MCYFDVSTTIIVNVSVLCTTISFIWLVCGVCCVVFGLSVEVESDVMGHWHHPQLGKGKDGRSCFVARTDYDVLLKDKNFLVWYGHYNGYSSCSIAKLTIYRLLQAGDLATPTEFTDLSVLDAKRLIRIVVNDLKSKKHLRAASQTMSYGSNFYNWINQDRGTVMTFRRNEWPPKIRKKTVFQIIPYNSDVWKLADVAQGLSYHSNFRNQVLGLRNRAAILFLWSSGIRVNGLCSLQYRHIKYFVERELTYEYLKRHFKVVNIEHWENEGLDLKSLPPLFLTVIPEIDSKLTGYGLSYYVTFVHKKAFEALLDWLQFRRDNISSWQPNDYVFPPFDFKKGTIANKMWNQHLVLSMLKTVARRAGINPKKIWVHCLRDSFRKVLRLCAPMDEETKEALMGHKQKGSKDNYFDAHDILLIAKLYVECDWTPGQASKIITLTTQMAQSKMQIKRLEARIEEYRIKLANEPLSNLTHADVEKIKEILKLINEGEVKVSR